MRNCFKNYLAIIFSLNLAILLSSCGGEGSKGAAQLGFVAPRLPLVMPNEKALNDLPVPGSERLVGNKPLPSKKAADDAYSIFTALHKQHSEEEEELKVNFSNLSANLVVKHPLDTKRLATPPKSYQEPSKNAPIGDRGLDEARKELLRQEDPNLKPSKKPWWGGSDS